MSSVTSKTPCAPAPLAWTTLGSDGNGSDVPFWNTLTVKVGKEVNQVEVLQEKGPRRANSLRGIGIEDRGAVGRSVDRRV
jgi:hypothetical protein